MSMKLWSDSWANGDRIAARYAAGKLEGSTGVTFADNLNPHLAWSDLPAGTQSLVLICHDFDVPSRPDDVNQPDREIPSDLPRVDFFHWVLVDLPPTLVQIDEGEFSGSPPCRASKHRSGGLTSAVSTAAATCP